MGNLLEGAGGSFNPKIYVADFGPLGFGLVEHKIDKKNATWFSENEGEGVKGRLELFRKLIRLSGPTRP